MRLASEIVPVCDVPSRDRQRMFSLMQRCYKRVERRQFEHDLQGKQIVIQVRNPEDDQLVGFSTQVVLNCDVNGQAVRALYSGDTVMEPSFWGDSALAHAWGNFALQLLDDHRCDGPLYWFLTSKGFRTYRYMPLFFKQFCPRFDQEPVGSPRAVLCALGEQVAGADFDPQACVIRRRNAAYATRYDVADPGRRVQVDPHVRYFIERNPGYLQGDELCCLAPLSRDNFTAAAYRVINATAPCEVR